jgi:hypothetical protein
VSDSSHPRAKYRYLLEDKNLRRWYDNIVRGSPACAEIYLRNLGNFCQIMNTTPAQLAQKPTKEIEDILMDYVTLAQKKHAGSYIRNTTKVVKSWLAHNEISLKRKIRITAANETPTLKDERVPTKEELKRIFMSSSTQARAASSIIAHSGLRPESLGNYHGTDGIRIRDFPELTINGKEVTFKKTPQIMVIRPCLSKTRLQYFTFLSDEACGYLKDYLEERLRDEEALTLDSAIIRPKFAAKSFIRTVNIGDLIRLGIRSAGFPWRPYVLRCYFDTMLMLAESKGLVLRDYRQFWMGHKGDIENRYTTNKQRLPESVIEDMREAYRKSQEYLETTKTENNARDEEKRKRQVLDTAKMLGYSDDRIKKIEEALAKYEHVDEALDEIKKLGFESRAANVSSLDGKKRAEIEDGKRKEVRLVKGERDLMQLLNDDWDLVKELSDQRFVLTKLYD